MPSPLRLFVLRVPDDSAYVPVAAGSAIAGAARRARTWLAAWRLASAIMLCVLMVLSGAARADGIEVNEARIEYQDGGFDLAASFDFELPPPLEDALNKGISLYFVVDFQLTRPRWYWFDEKPVNASRSVRLSYHPLTRQYRVSTGGLQLPFMRLKGALQFIQRVRGWRVFERNMVKPGETYQAETRMRLDLTQLPKPFQINAVNTREWNLASEWRRFNFTVPTEFPQPPAPTPSPPVLPVPAPPPVPGPASAASAAVAGETRAVPFAQTVSTVLSPNTLVQPAAGQP
ncbi:signal peptide protein [Burkholderiaceae bacterium 16]|nr:signal peptide protein [Burkholderiaceae bacterium 16]